MIIFGNGSAYARPLTDYAGNALATPTPVRFGVIQDLGVDISRELKMLHGEKAFPVAVGSGKAKISCKGKLGDFKASIWGSLYAGRSASTTVTAAVTDDPIVIATSVTTTAPSSGTYANDLGITNASTGLPFVRVASAPAVGQYSVSGIGTYTFNATDVGVAALRNFEYTATIAGNSQFNLVNEVMGLAPTFSYIGQTLFGGKVLTLKLNSCVSGKFNLPQKNDDYAQPDFEFEAFDNGSGTIGTLRLSEPA